MRGDAKRRLSSLALLGSFAWVAAAAGCSLGLDRSKIGQFGGQDGSAESDGPLAESTAGEGGDGRSGSDGNGPSDGSPQGADVCSTDSDCQISASAGGGCVSSAKCDLTWHVCMLDVCDAGACKAQACNVSMNMCTLPADYAGTFSPASFTVHFGGVGTNPQWAISAAWPFVFLITTNGVIAYDVFDPTSDMPPAVTIHGLPFFPDYTFSVGRRVYFLTNEFGAGPTYHQSIAWIDVPQNPFITEFVANAAWVATVEKNGVQQIVKDGLNGFYASYGTSSLLPTADVHAPLTDGTIITGFPNNNLAMNADIVSASGTQGTSSARLVAYAYDGTARAARYSTVTAPGTASATAGNSQKLDSMGPIEDQQTWAQGDDGSVLWEAALLGVADGGSTSKVASACLTWLIDSSTATSFDAAKCSVLESYNPPASQLVTLQPAWIDPNTAIGFAAAGNNPTASVSAHVVTKSPAQTGPGVVSYISVGPANVGTASSGGFGYALARTDAMNQTCTVYIYAPACAEGGG